MSMMMMQKTNGGLLPCVRSSMYIYDTYSNMVYDTGRIHMTK